MCDVRAHASPRALWCTQRGRVYDLTTWLDRHPGGRQALLNRGGKDADEDLDFHSARGQALWETVFIGRLVACPGRPHVPSTLTQTCALV